MRSNDWFERDLIGDTSRHEDASLLWVASSAKAAAVNPGTRIAALAAIVAAFAWTADVLWLIPLTFVALFGAFLLNGRARQAAQSRAGALPIRLPPSTSFSDGQAQTLINRLRLVREAIQRAVDAGPQGAAFDVSRALQPVPEIERDVLVLATRVEYLARFLESSPLASARSELLRLEALARWQEHTPGIDETLQTAIARCRARLDSVGGLGAQRASLLASAEEVLGALEQMPAAITSLQLARLTVCDPRPVRGAAQAAAIMQAFHELGAATAEEPPAAATSA